MMEMIEEHHKFDWCIATEVAKIPSVSVHCGRASTNVFAKLSKMVALLNIFLRSKTVFQKFVVLK